ncbi:MAG: hypothetical protein COT34_01820 [Candidatus Nealsonbacteria bacterium CG08_land_8_20_14_0_20_43_11]|uniref:O-antigen ligase-related domain-containing protein n=1 Tax=Candidatus Nealsonbacteria bacterium CG08_land_8_20_14_0_20_43_11 TaxID=1974706 RepID=A0A2M6T0V1_9BACT|nr:MAG: hypothetical protein COT34_01820 [Candidatus Nealsonbacteria bacterium CG08_land_8_20_14_0_20_43_11]
MGNNKENKLSFKFQGCKTLCGEPRPLYEVSNFNIEKACLAIIKAGVFLILLTPLVFNPANLFPSVFSKSIYFRFLTEIIFCFYLLLLLANRKYRPSFSLIFISVSLFTLVLAVSTLLMSINPFRSFWGTIERMDGLIVQLHLFVFFVVLTAVFRKKDDWQLFLKFFILVSLPLAFIGLCQKLGISAFYVPPDSPKPGLLGPFGFQRVSTLMGNPIFYAAYLVFVIFSAAFLVFAEKNKNAKIFFSAILGLNFLTLIFTGTRSAWVGVFLGVVFLSFIWLFFLNKNKRNQYIFLAIVLIGLLFFLIALVLFEKGYLGQTDFLARYEATFYTLVGLPNARIPVWQLALKAVKERPWLGFGLDSFSYVFSKYYDAKLLALVPQSLFFDRAHNKLIDTLIFNGVIGLIAYLLVFASAIFVLVKHREKDNPFASLILIALLIAYLVQNFFGFDTISSYFCFFFILAFIDRFFSKETVEKSVVSEKNEAGLPLRKEVKIVFSVLIISLTITALYYFSFLPYRANLRFSAGRRLFSKDKVKEGIELIDKSFYPHSFSNVEYKFFALAAFQTSKPFLSVLPEEAENQQLVSAKIKELAKSLEEHFNAGPEIKQMDGYLLLAQIYRDLYLRTKEPSFLDDEERLINKALSFSSQFPQTFRVGGEMYFLKGNKEEGKKFFLKAYELDKNLSELYEWRGAALIESGEKEKGAAFFRRAMKLGDFYTKNNFNLSTIWRITNIYEETKNYPEMARFYEEVIYLYPKELTPEPQLYASLATVYFQLAEKEKARQTTEKMMALFPALKSQGKEFLKLLEGEIESSK